jgi:hypothetical protein
MNSSRLRNHGAMVRRGKIPDGYRISSPARWGSFVREREKDPRPRWLRVGHAGSGLRSGHEGQVRKAGRVGHGDRDGTSPDTNIRSGHQHQVRTRKVRSGHELRATPQVTPVRTRRWGTDTNLGTGHEVGTGRERSSPDTNLGPIFHRSFRSGHERDLPVRTRGSGRDTKMGRAKSGHEDQVGTPIEVRFRRSLRSGHEGRGTGHQRPDPATPRTAFRMPANRATADGRSRRPRQSSRRNGR